MYSVEDLLISHGYKISSNSNVPPSHLSSSQEQRPASRSNSRCEIVDKWTGPGAVNGYKADSVYGGVGKQASSQSGPSDTEIRDKNQRTEEDNANLVDGHSLGGTSDSRFSDAHREMYTHPRPEHDVSYWRRRGQDFNMLLDYVDIRDPQGKQLGSQHKAEGMQRRPESALTTEEHRRERQRRADSARARERELALYQWKMTAERKYQSLGTEEWRPAVGIGRHMSESEGERWAQEQRRPRTAEGAVPPRTKAKSQSLPRMTMPSDSIQYLSMPSTGQDPCASFRINGHHSRLPKGRNLSEGKIREQWIDNSRSGVQSAPPSKPRFSRPLRPPSYEVHQQMRGSSEMLPADFVPHARDRTPLPFTRQDYFAQELGGSGMEPPGYIPPPSYRRQPVIRGGHRIYANSMGNYQYRGDPYMQGPAMAEVQEWFMRQTGIAWPDNYRDGRRSMPCRRQAYPGYVEEHTGNVQYIPFDDPRVRHISGGRMDGNSLTDADKIRNITKESPITSTCEKSPDDSAFLVSGKPFSSTEASNINISDCVNEAVTQKELSREMINLKSTNDENSNRYPASPDYPNNFQTTSSQHKPSIDQRFCETVTQVKTFEAQTAAENKKNKKKIKETMFCLVSVPINMVSNKETTDTNNNEKVSSIVVAPAENSVTQNCSKDMPKIANSNDQAIQSSSSLNIKRTKKPSVRKEVVDVWSLQASVDKEMCSAGSWPGDQYKNQETQTGSLEGSRNTNAQNLQKHVTYYPRSSTDSGLASECIVSYNCPQKVQNNFNLSSNSAFCQTKAASSSSLKSPVQVLMTSSPPSPDRQPPLRNSVPKPQALNGQEAFGQFLLKPVNRRPWDAIGELESFNKELQDHNAKQQTIIQATEDLDEALRNILEADITGFNTPEVAAYKVKQHHIDKSPKQQLKNDKLDFRSDSEQTGEDFREVGSAYSFVNPDPPSSPEIDSGFVKDLSMMQDDLRLNSLEIPVPKESLLKDVGLTVYTPIPDSVEIGSPVGLSPESPMLTSPSDNSETSEVLQVTSSESGGDQNTNSPNFSPNHKHSNGNIISVTKHDHKRVSEKSSEKSLERSPHIHGVRNQHFTFMESYDHADNDDNLYLCNEKTIADEHLEALLSQEKASSLPTEDLSNLYQIQCAKGIPVHESIEQRAARILGIAISAEALTISHDSCQQSQENEYFYEHGEEKTEIALQTMKLTPNEETEHVSSEYEQVIKTSVHTSELIKKKDTAAGEDHNSISDKLSKESHMNSLVLDLPEFPPNNLRLSLPVTEDEDLILSVCGGERKVTPAVGMFDGQPDESIVYHPSPVCKNEETSAESINPIVEDESMSCVSGFKKEIQKGRGEEEMGKERTENRVQEDKVLGGEEEQFLLNEMRVNEWQAALEEKINEDLDSMRDKEEETKEEMMERAIQSSQSMGCSVPVPQSRSGTVVKREITLPDTFNMTTDSDSLEDDEIQSVSDSYDPSRVERV